MLTHFSGTQVQNKTFLVHINTMNVLKNHYLMFKRYLPNGMTIWNSFNWMIKVMSYVKTSFKIFIKDCLYNRCNIFIKLKVFLIRNFYRFFIASISMFDEIPNIFLVFNANRNTLLRPAKFTYKYFKNDKLHNLQLKYCNNCTYVLDPYGTKFKLLMYLDFVHLKAF